jgi:hypothetical protein
MRERVFFGSLMVLAGLALAGALFAVSAYPMWDDAYLDLMALDPGAIGVAESALDRPLAGQICEWMVIDRSEFYLKAATVHWMVCFGTALFTLYLARQLFPNRPALALATACLAATPFLCRTQIVLATHPIVPGLSSVTSFLAIYLIAGTIPSRLPAWNLALRWLAGVAALVIGGLISEYFVASALAGIVWIFFLGLGLERPARMRSYLSSFALLVLMVGIYLVYHQIASAEARQNVRPEYLLTQDLAWRAKVLLPAWASAVYTGCLGALLERIAALRLMNYVNVASLGAGTMLAILVQLLLARRNIASEQADDGSPRSRLLVGLILAVALGLLPIVVMGVHPDSTIDVSRFWAPVVPFALCASAGLLASLLKDKKLWLLPPLFALLAGWALVSDGVQASRELRRVSAWGPEVRQHLGESGICVAIFENGWPLQHGPQLLASGIDYELTGRLSQTWSQQERQRFWAFPNLSGKIQDATSGIDFDRHLDSPEIHRTLRGLARIGPISRVLWVYVTPAGDLQIRAVDVPETSTKAPPPSP